MELIRIALLQAIGKENEVLNNLFDVGVSPRQRQYQLKCPHNS